MICPLTICSFIINKILRKNNIFYIHTEKQFTVSPTSKNTLQAQYMPFFFFFALTNPTYCAKINLS